MYIAINYFKAYKNKSKSFFNVDPGYLYSRKDVLNIGSFLDLSEMDEWREMAEAAVGGEMGEPEEEEKNLRCV